MEVKRVPFRSRLREQEIERHGLSRTRRADDREIAEITLVKVEEIRPCSGRLEQGDRIAPMIALALANCEIMPARQPREIACRNQSPPCEIFEITRKLRTEGVFERDPLAHRDYSQSGQTRAHP